MSKAYPNAKGRIPYLDGLRAYSIIVVVMGHSSRLMPWLSTRAATPFRIVFTGGTLGVRVFFVLSGFLITSLLLEERETTGKISISGFYERRIARIFPAFYVYFLALLPLVLTHRLNLTWQSLLTAATYTWNYGHLWGGTSAPDAYCSLGHLWSLSLEEQFYLIWPACLVLLGSIGARRLALVGVVLLPFVRLAYYFLVPSNRGQLGIMFHVASDPILWGALAAFASKNGAIERARTLKYRNALPWICGAVIFVLCPLAGTIRGAGIVFVLSAESVSVVVFIFWLLSGKGGPIRWALESWPMVQLGLISYSVYIWQALFTLWDGFPKPISGLITRWAALLGVSIVSYRLIEVPSRRLIRRWFAQSEPTDRARGNVKVPAALN